MFCSVEGKARTENNVSREDSWAQKMKGAREEDDEGESREKYGDEGDSDEEDQSGDKDGERSESGDDEESGEEEEEEDDDDDDEAEEVIEERVGAKSHDKAKSRIRRVVEVVTAWKALPRGLGDTALLVKMANDVLKHLTVIGSGGPLGTTTSGGTQSQPATSKRKVTATTTGPSYPKGKKSRN
ncbi:hypothetical protein Scep_015025 [Stephania cephalantha]|uniref:Uncharacterized protein n=1 Tax=Stephania cephalantha TaxID=152367 RepID=A0AAP0J2D3_9MAGN